MVGSTIEVPFGCGTPRAIRVVIGVAALPMSICPQAMSKARPSSEIALVIPVMACFVEVYAAEPGRGVCAEIDPLLMIRPPCGFCSFIIRKAALAQRKQPFRFTFTTCVHCSQVKSPKLVLG